MNMGQERQFEADAINAQTVENLKAEQDSQDAANEANRQGLVEPTIADLQQKLDALKAQRPEDDPDIEALQNQIEAMKQNQ